MRSIDDGYMWRGFNFIETLDRWSGRTSYKKKSIMKWNESTVILEFGIWWMTIRLSITQVRISEPNSNEQFWIKNSTIDDITSASCLPDVIVVDSVLNKLLEIHKPKLNGFIPLRSEFSDIWWRMQIKPFNNIWFASDNVDRILMNRKD